MKNGQFQLALPTGGSMPLAMELPIALRRLLIGQHISSVCSSEASDKSCSDAKSDTTDWSDIQASLGGDGEAYSRLVQRHQQDVAEYMWRFTRSRVEWEELVHDVFVEAYFSLRGYKARSPWSHWLKRIATRVGYRHWKLRRRQRDRAVPLTESVSAAVATRRDSVAAQDAGQLVHDLLRQLAPRDRLVMTLKYLEGYTVADIASLTGWSETMVKVQTHRAKKRLRKIWAKAEETP